MSSFTGDEWILVPVSAFNLLQYVVLVELYEVRSLMQRSSWERKDLSQSSRKCPQEPPGILGPQFKNH